MFWWRYRMQFWQLCRKCFEKKPKKVCPLSTNVNFFSKNFSSTCSNWHILGSFEDFARKIPKVCGFFFGECSRVFEKVNYCKTNYLPSHFFYGLVECIFDNTAQGLLTESWNLFHSVSTKDRFFPESVSFKLIPWKRRMHFWQPWWKRSDKTPKNSAHCPEVIKVHF